MGAERRRLVVIYAIAAACCLIAVSGASAKVIPKLESSLTVTELVTGPTGATSWVTKPETRLGAHADFTADLTFSYGGTGADPDDPEDPETYPPPSDWRETVDNLVVDIPPGLVGNPNAVPFEQRCDAATFETSVCPNSATVGELVIETGLVNGPPGSFTSIIPIGPVLYADSFTKVSLIKTAPEVPAKIGVLVKVLDFAPIRTIIQIAPDTESDLRLRTTTPNGIDSELYAGPDMSVPGEFVSDFRIDRMQLKFFGRLPNGNAFMTNPTSCVQWTSQVWANARYVNDNVDADPLRSGSAQFKAGESSTITPDCTNQTSVPFPAKGTVSISSNQRDVSPAFDFVIENPGVQANEQASTSAKKIVTHVPAAINVDVQQLGRTCAEDLFAADKCAASTKVGSVKIETPLIAAGLTGDVHLVRRNEAGLPDLGLRVRGAISFTQRGKNRYVGVRGNEIETTFDNIPQVGFSKLSFHLDGGANGLLRTLACPTGNKQPAVGNFTYDFTAWTGATTSSTTPLNAANCFGIQKLRSFKCVYRLLRFQPTYTSRARLKRVVLKVDRRRAAIAKSGNFGFKVSARKFKKGKHKIELAATYDDGTVSKKQSKFKRC